MCVLCVLADISDSDRCRDDDDDDDDDDSVRNDRLSAGERDDEESLPVYLWRPGQTTDVIGEWEQHTRVCNSLFTACCFLYSPSCVSVRLSLSLSACLLDCLSVCLSICFSPALSCFSHWLQQLFPDSFHQPRPHLSPPDSSLSPDHLSLPVSASPLSPSITPALFHSGLKAFLFHKSYPP